MLGKLNIIKMISDGDLDKLSKFLEKDQARRFHWHQWPNGPGSSSTGTILHMAAYFNQPAIIKFLVNEYGMDVNEPNKRSRRTPLHYACENGSYEAASLLLQLGADSTLQCNDLFSGGTPFELCRDMRIKELLSPPVAPLQKEPPVKEIAQKTVETKIEDAWSIKSSSEIVHEYEYALQEGRHHVADIFNFSAGRLTTIIKDLQNKSQSHTDQFFNESDIQGNKTLSEAFARLKHTASNDSQPTEQPEAPDPGRYKLLKDFGLQHPRKA